jgi:hypothetical protein
LSLVELGMKPKIGDWFDVKHLMRKCGIKEEMYRTTRRFLEILAQVGYFYQSYENINKFQILKLFPLKEDLVKAQDLINSDETVLFKTNEEKPIQNFYMMHMKNFLAGTENILSALFPEEESEFSALKVYTTTQVKH